MANKKNFGCLIMKKLLGDYKCPCCNKVLLGNFDVEHMCCEREFDRTVIYDVYKLFCPNTGRRITMVETSFSDACFFWKTSDEGILDKYLTIKKIKNKRIRNLLINLYHPIPNELPISSEYVKIRLNQLFDEGYRFSVVVPEFMDKIFELSWLKDRVFKKWVLEEKFFKMCYSTVYPSLLAELNIVTEMSKWADRKMISLYPTILPDFEYVGQEIDWNAMGQKVLV